MRHGGIHDGGLPRTDDHPREIEMKEAVPEE
jgi:hypothetical protein